MRKQDNKNLLTIYTLSIFYASPLEYCLYLAYFVCIAGSAKGRPSLSESENLGSIPSPAAKIYENIQIDYHLHNITSSISVGVNMAYIYSLCIIKKYG